MATGLTVLLVVAFLGTTLSACGNDQESSDAADKPSETARSSKPKKPKKPSVEPSESKADALSASVYKSLEDFLASLGTARADSYKLIGGTCEDSGQEVGVGPLAAVFACHITAEIDSAPVGIDYAVQRQEGVGADEQVCWSAELESDPMEAPPELSGCIE